MKTARFADVVARAGTPEPYTAWSDPRKDTALQRAVKAGRVLTVHQDNVGARKDYGTVGFHADGTALFLIFPKSLREFSERRIVGVNYDAVPAPPRGKVSAKTSAVFSTESKKPKARRGKPDAGSSQKNPSRGGADREKAEVLAFTDPTGAALSAPPDEEESPTPTTRDELMREIKAAMKDIKAGKVVAAYERLARSVRED